MMKQKDASVATSLIIQGYLRSNEESSTALAEVVGTIRREVDDWAENLVVGDLASVDAVSLEVDLRAFGAVAPRTPMNLSTAAVMLATEVLDLCGPEEVRSLAARLVALADAE